MRAGLLTKEPEYLAKWAAQNLDELRSKKQQEFSKTYTLHDGPPYPNGNIHMGHALNKILKDIVNRAAWMAGQKIDFTPGWDCHGLPIETQVIKELKANKEESKKADVAWFRNRCKEFALGYVDNQRDEFKRLGILGNWENPYLTLNPEYEAGVVKMFGKMAENGLIFRGRKPIHWCPSCETALAEAEIEYADHKSPSITIKFSVKTASEKLAKIIGSKTAAVLVWTTTPWTLPANVAVAAHPDFEYSIIQSEQGLFIVGSALVEKITTSASLTGVQKLGSVLGAELGESVLAHPFIDRESPIILADFVTQEDGTGFVHIAPGHGQDDYLAGLRYHLPIVMPVDDQGKLDATTQWPGVFVFDANKPITQHLDALGKLLKLQWITHSYPHCWRCKNPVIFRATDQWFVAMDTKMAHTGTTLRESALKAIDEVNWVPSWGEKRIRGMIEKRPDWCISRQRSWGIPIPVALCTHCNHPEMTGKFNEAVVDLIQKNGSLAWFSEPAEHIFNSLTCSQCGKSEFKKETDILDVWFESGASFASVLNETTYPAELYLEGSDQHRGWFQSSLLISLGAHGQAPYKSVLTHGFLVDDQGRKMSKSMGNVVSPQDVLKTMGADVLRWWVLSTDFKNDVAISQNILKQVQDSFSKVRNTLRFLLSNLYDFDPENDALSAIDLNELDRWILAEVDVLSEKVQSAYQTFDFHIIAHSVHDFCAVTLSSAYMDAVKDRLYCAEKTGKDRRSTQTAMAELFSRLMKLLAPVLVFSMEDAYQFWPGRKLDSIHLNTFPKPYYSQTQTELIEKYAHALDLKSKVYKELELWRNEKRVKSFMECQVTLTVPEILKDVDWASFLIVSQVKISVGEFSYSVQLAEGDKCQRCWRLLPLRHHICERCETAIARYDNVYIPEPEASK